MKPVIICLLSIYLAQIIAEQLHHAEWVKVKKMIWVTECQIKRVIFVVPFKKPNELIKWVN
jgi:hypothetical protein